MTHLEGSVFVKKSVGLIIGFLLVSYSLIHQTSYVFLLKVYICIHFSFNTSDVFIFLFYFFIKKDEIHNINPILFVYYYYFALSYVCQGFLIV